jgi:MFS family permease
MLIGWFDSVFMTFVGNIITAISLGVMYPELQATFEDYICRCKKFGNDLIGLTAIAGSIPYVIGPIANGFIIDGSGERSVFGAWGIVLSIFSLSLFFIVPRKVRLPEQQLTQALTQ